MSDFVTSDNRRIHFEDTGSGPPLLCLAGLTRNSADFSFFARHAAGVRMIAMDYRGRGQSQFDEDWQNYNVLREGHDALELRYDVNLRKALLEQAATGAMPDLWLFFEALKDLPLGVIRGANSDILTADTLARMRDRHPGLIAAEVPDRGHAPFLDEPEALEIIRAILDRAG